MKLSSVKKQSMRNGLLVLSAVLLLLLSGCGKNASEPVAPPPLGPTNLSPDSPAHPGNQDPKIPPPKKPPEFIRLLTKGLPNNFLIGTGEKVVDHEAETIVLEPIDETGNRSFWLVHPFYQPQRIFIKAEELSEPYEPIDPRPWLEQPVPLSVSIQEKMGNYSIGPFPWYGNFGVGITPFEWNGEQGIMLFCDSKLVGIFDLAKEQSIPMEKPVNRFSKALSADNSKLAYVVNGELVVQDLTTGERKNWKVAPADGSNPDATAEMLSWSPNGRYLVGSWYPTGPYTVPKLWMLDMETGEITGLTNEQHPFSNPFWSPDGNQVVVDESFIFYSEGYDNQRVLIDLPSKKMEVVVPRSTERVAYRFTWDEQGQLLIQKSRNHPDGLQAVAYDPDRDLYADEEVDEFQPLNFIGSRLHILNEDRQKLWEVDLQPALEAAGIPWSQLKKLLVWTYRSPDGQYLMLETKAVLQKEGGGEQEVLLYGSVEMETRTASFCPPEDPVPETPFFPVNGASHWSGSQVLLDTLGREREPRIFDTKALTITDYPEAKNCLYASFGQKGLLFVSETEVGIIGPDDQKQTIMKAPDGCTFVLPIIPSPNGKYLAVPCEKRGEENLRWITIEVLSVEEIPLG